MNRLARLFVFMQILVATGLLMNAVSGNGTGRTVIQLTIDGAIGPAADDYVGRAIESAARQQAELLVIRIDTPGGLDTAMRGIVKSITSSSVPPTALGRPATIPEKIRMSHIMVIILLLKIAVKS